MVNRIYTRLPGKGGKIYMRARRAPVMAALPGPPPRAGGWENLVVNTSYVRMPHLRWFFLAQIREPKQRRHGL
jgi:hypothetical protein